MLEVPDLGSPLLGPGSALERRLDFGPFRHIAGNGEDGQHSRRQVDQSLDPNANAPNSSNASRNGDNRARIQRLSSQRDGVRLPVRALNVLLLVDLLAALLTTYMRIAEIVSWPWFAAASPWFIGAALSVGRSSLKLATPPSSAISSQHLGQTQIAIQVDGAILRSRYEETHVKSILLVCSGSISLALALAEICANRSRWDAKAVLAPVLGCLSVFVLFSARDLCKSTPREVLRRQDQNSFVSGTTGRCARTSAKRLELTVYTLSLITFVLAALKIDDQLDVSWLLVLAWPVIVLVFWAIAAIGLSCLVTGWLATAIRGQAEELDGLFREMVGDGAYYGSPRQRSAFVLLATSCILAFDMVILGAFVALFHTIKVLNGTVTGPSSLGAIFIPLIMDALIILVIVIVMDFVVLPYLRLEATRHERAPRTLLIRKLNSCITCRHPVSQLVSIHDPNVHVEEDNSQPHISSPKGNSKHSEGILDCAVCMIRPSDTIFLPCGHSGICQPCARQWMLGASLLNDNEEAMLNEALAQFSPLETPLFLIRKSQTFFQPRCGASSSSHLDNTRLCDGPEVSGVESTFRERSPQ